LIKDGAIFVETLEDIEQEISPSSLLHLEDAPAFFEEEISSLSLDATRQVVNENLSHVPISIDELIRECQLSTSRVWIVLLEMEIAGCLDRLPGGRVALKEEWKSL